jgi:tetraacyldisaccharide 4'-kinase
VDEATFLDIVSGRQNGIGASCLRGGLAAMSVGYGIAIRARNAAFDIGLRKSHAATVPVISVGNLTTGGTGKTPVVGFLANWFHERGVKATLLSRGYRSLDGHENDEKLVLDQLCPHTPHVQNPDRVAGAKQAVTEHAAELILLDDGFQHRRLKRDLDIVLVDALNPWGHGRLLPRGLLREPISGLKRADLVIITRADQCSADEKQAIINRIHQTRGNDEHVEIAFKPEGLIDANGNTCGFDSLAGTQVAAFCGIGNPAGFRSTLTTAGLQVFDDAFQTFPDHHHYTAADLTRLADVAKQQAATACVTTLKDLVKIRETELAGIPLWAVGIGVEVLQGASQLEKHLDRLRS